MGVGAGAGEERERKRENASGREGERGSGIGRNCVAAIRLLAMSSISFIRLSADALEHKRARESGDILST